VSQNALVKQVALSLLFFGRCVLIFSFFWSLFCFFFLSFFFSLSLSFVNCFIVYKEEGREDKRSEEEEEEEIREEEALFVLLFFQSSVFRSFSLSLSLFAEGSVVVLSLEETF
jgi:uncharacterized SAM-binding protein YcdF (DUF218 family)